MTTYKLETANYMIKEMNTLETMIEVLKTRQCGLYDDEARRAGCFGDLRHNERTRARISKILEDELEILRKEFSLL